MVTLKNVSRRMQVYQLDHGAFQEHASKDHAFKLVHAVVVEHARNGALSARRKPRLVPTSISFAADEMVHSLPNEALECASIKRAVAAGELRIVAIDDSKVEPAKPVEAKADAPAASATKKNNDPSSPSSDVTKK